MFTTFLIILAVVISTIILFFIKYLPFFYIFLLFFIILSYGFIKGCKTNLRRLICFNFAVICLLLALSEAFLGINIFQPKYDLIDLNSKKLIVKDPVRGYRPPINAEFTKTEKNPDGSIVFSVTYRTNKFGLRVAPHDLANLEPSIAQKKIAFMGCSFTFGEGLEDNQTLPFMVEEQLSPRYQTYNFGFLGYGPHQMLRLMETGLLPKLMEQQKPDVVIYSANMNHVERVAGANPYILWDFEGPKYVLGPNGSVKHAGRFIDNPFHQEPRFMISVLNRWFLLNRTRLIPKICKSQRTPEDIDLFIKVIKKTDHFIKNNYKAKFFILFWPDFQDKNYPFVVDQLKRENIDFITVDKIMEKYPDNPNKYVIDSYGHPSKLANEYLVDFLRNYLQRI